MKISSKNSLHPNAANISVGELLFCIVSVFTLIIVGFTAWSMQPS